MKNLITSALLILAAILQAQEPLKLASDVWPPFTNTSNQKTIALDIVNTAFFRMNEPMNVSITNFDKVLQGIESGLFSGCGAMWKTPEREETMLFSEPYLQNRIVIVKLNSSDGALEKPNRKLGLVGSYAYDIDMLDDENIEIVYSESEQANFNKLLAGEVDIIMVDELLIHYLMIAQKEEVQKNLTISSPVAVKSLHLAVSKDNPRAQSIIDRFNREIETMIGDGTYNRVLELNWIMADLDGDGKAEYVFNGENAGTTPPQESYNLFDYDSASTASTSYRVNGTLYQSWDDVPQQYKQNLNPDPGKGNMIIRF